MAGIQLRYNTTQGVVPTTGSFAAGSGELAMNVVDGKLYAYRNNGAASVIQINPVAVTFSTQWQNGTVAPVETFEYTERALLFSTGLLQQVTMFMRVPTAYKSGSQINLIVGHYTPGSTGVFRFQASATLIRKNLDAVTSTTNVYTSTNTDQALTVANMYMQVTYDLTSTLGKINSVAVSPGDLISVTLTRIAPTGTDDLNDVRMVPSTTEVTFS